MSAERFHLLNPRFILSFSIQDIRLGHNLDHPNRRGRSIHHDRQLGCCETSHWRWHQISLLQARRDEPGATVGILMHWNVSLSECICADSGDRMWLLLKENIGSDTGELRIRHSVLPRKLSDAVGTFQRTALRYALVWKETIRTYLDMMKTEGWHGQEEVYIPVLQDHLFKVHFSNMGQPILILISSLSS